MDTNDVVATIEELLNSSGTALGKKTLVIKSLAILRKNHKKDLVPHLNSKVEFQRYWFQPAIKSDVGIGKLLLLKGDKFDLKDRALLKTPEKLKSIGMGVDEADKLVLKLIREMEFTRFEELVRVVIEERYKYHRVKGHPANREKNDGGLDFFGIKNDPDDHKRSQVFIAQAKQHKANIDSPQANAFKGAVDLALKDQKFTKVMALFVSSTDFTAGFIKAMNAYSEPGRTYIFWNGKTFAEKIVGTGLGFRYSIDMDFWINYGLNPEHFNEHDEVTVY